GVSARCMEHAGPFPFTSLQRAALAAGIGRAAMQAAVEQAETRVSVVNQVSWVEWPAVQNTAASGQAAIDALRASLFSMAADCQSEVDRTGTLSDRTKALAHALADH